MSISLISFMFQFKYHHFRKAISDSLVLNNSISSVGSFVVVVVVVVLFLLAVQQITTNLGS